MMLGPLRLVRGCLLLKAWLSQVINEKRGLIPLGMMMLVLLSLRTELQANTFAMLEAVVCNCPHCMFTKN